MTIREFLTIESVADAGAVQAWLEKLPKPATVGRVKTPATLNDLSMGELMQLQGIRTGKWVAREVERINKLFASASVPPTPEEKKAGYDRLNFGLFGLVDYYALRMGITDHEAVERVPWVRVYKCMDMDARRMVVERRLRKILMDTNK